jgi:hypothetical protein
MCPRGRQTFFLPLPLPLIPDIFIRIAESNPFFTLAVTIVAFW